MTIAEIQSYIGSLIDQAFAGQSIEHPKLDFKRQWYDLIDVKGISTFIKDTTAMANTVGLDGFIVFGFDETDLTFHATTFSDSKLKDTAQLPDLINRYVDRAFDIRYYPITVREQPLNVLHIPPSLDKPHVIRLHRSWPKGVLKEEKHKIFVRKTSKIEEANKYDFDLMYYDRKNITAPAALHVSFDLGSLYANVKPGELSNGVQQTECIYGTLGITFENTGGRAIPIKSMILEVAVNEDDYSADWLSMYFNKAGKDPAKITVIEPNSLVHHDLAFESLTHFSIVAKEALTRLMEFTTRPKFLIIKSFSLFTTNNAQFLLHYQKTEDYDMLSFSQTPTNR